MIRTLAITGIYCLSIIFSSCTQNQTYNRGYVISQTQVESEGDASSPNEP